MHYVLNRKGFTGIELAIVLVAITAMGYFAAPQIGKAVNNVVTGAQNKQKATHKVHESYPMFYQDKDGNYIPAPTPYIKMEESYNSSAIEPPETLWEKFIHLGIMIIPIIMIIAYLGAFPLVKMWVNKLKAKIAEWQSKEEELKYDAQLIVVSVKKGLDTLDEVNRLKFLDAMSMVQDKSTKDLVKELLKSAPRA